jgi:polar amino acid transport system permease protein
LNYQFDWNLFAQGPYLQWIGAGLLMTLKLSVVSIVLSFLLGLLIAVMRMSHQKIFRGFAIGYLEFIRNTPLLVQLFFWYFGSYKVLPASWNEWLNGTNQFEFIAAVIALTIYTSAFIAEDIRSGVLSIAKEQTEAGRSFGFTYLQTMRYIILPQAVRITVPPLVNQFLNLAKNSSLAMTIGVAELTYQARQIESHTLKSFEAFAVATAIYLVISLLLTFGIETYSVRVLNRRGASA